MTEKSKGPGKGLIGRQYKPLTGQQVKKIHEASLAILERTGVQVDAHGQCQAPAAANRTHPLQSTVMIGTGFEVADNIRALRRCLSYAIGN
jgi:hypothetical protein